MSETAAEVRRRLKAAPEKVFAAFAEARLVSQWLSPSPEITLSLLQFDFRVGGAYRFAYQERPSLSPAFIDRSNRPRRSCFPGSSNRRTSTQGSNLR